MFAKDYNELLDEILTSYRNMAPIKQIDVARLKAERPDIYSEYLTESAPDTSVGTLLFMQAATDAAMLYGIYKTVDTAVDQFFIDTAIRLYKERHASDLGVNSVGKSDMELTAEVSDAKKLRLMGGNKYDYTKWSKSVSVDDETVIDATVYPLARGVGTFDVIIVSSLHRGVPSAELIAGVLEKLTDERPVAGGYDWGLRVVGPVISYHDISISGTGSKFDREKTANDIASYVDSLVHGQTLYTTQLVSIAIQNGADNATCIVPAADIVPVIDSINGIYQVIRYGEVAVS